ncbi:XRE family transcriptional regulator [Paenibacillus sp. FSL M7-0420]|uniref:XRE family transcriptional regulator n=1 Tax=Paenibacillus sp. FSL M7-0420 TaxID=2921609 RepID=UPI0030F80AD7
MNDRMEWKIKRIQQQIKQNIVAAHIGCSSTLISLYENNKGEMSEYRVKQYKNFIEAGVKNE